jgi:dTDP-4-dehydrorhamnose reductase
VTGAGGQLGRELLGAAERAGVGAHGRTHADLDIADPEQVKRCFEELDPDVVANCAAFTRVDECEQRLAEAERVNAEGPRVLAEACRGRALLLHVSTEYVFAGEGAGPIPEEAPAEPRSVYGQTKLAGERALRDSGCEHLIVRSQWLFGPGPNFARSILAAARKGRPLRVVEDQWGRPTWAGALAPALVQAIGVGVRGTLHLACDGVCSWYDFAREIVDEAARRDWLDRVSVTPVSTAEFPRPARRPANGVLDLTRARRLGLGLGHWRDALGAYFAGEEQGNA